MTTTPNVGLDLPDFDISPWHEDVNDNFRIIDSLFYSMFGIGGLSGPWRNSTAVVVDQKYFDQDDGTFYIVLVNHTTAAAPTTFSEDRIANPAYWDSLDLTAALGAAADALVYRDAAEGFRDEAETFKDTAGASATSAASSAGTATTAKNTAVAAKDAAEAAAANLADFADQSEAEAGIATDVVMSPLSVAQYAATQALGIGQSWQDVRASRAVETIYQNTTGRPIMVAIKATTVSTTTSVRVSSDGATWIAVGSIDQGINNISFVVPTNWYYQVNGAVTGSPAVWSELR